MRGLQLASKSHDPVDVFSGFYLDATGTALSLEETGAGVSVGYPGISAGLLGDVSANVTATLIASES